MPAGSALIVRDYNHPARTALAFRLRNICRQREIAMLVGADIALAKHCGADGIHFPSWAPPRAVKGFMTSAACHNQSEVTRASARGIDAAILSPAFATMSHPGGEALGPNLFKQIAATARLPIIALGGITADNADQLCGKNVAGIAAISAFAKD